MRTLFETANAAEVKQRLQQLQSTSQRQWGKMTAAQALAHCSAGLEMAVGDSRPARMFLGRLLGPLVKRRAIWNEEPLRRNTPTAPELLITDERDLEVERRRLATLIDRFAAGGPSKCTTHPHTFFGPLTPDEWSALMYKHLDHHLRQFGV